ncbi:MAG: hypothetical protein ACTS2F_08190 [Thainema sp.]
MQRHLETNSYIRKRKRVNQINNSALILMAFATAFFPRFLSSLGAPSIINFVHFGTIPGAFFVALLTTQTRNQQRVKVIWELLGGILIFLVCLIFSGLLNNAGIVNIFLQFMFQAEPFMLLVAIIAVPLHGEKFKRFQYWLLGFAASNLLLAIAQAVLMPTGIYPKPKGGTLADNIVGVFGGGGGSAANYVSCTVSIFFGLYFFNRFKDLPLWARALPLLGALYQTQASDSKQVFLALVLGWMVLSITQFEKPGRLFAYVSIGLIGILVFSWALFNVEAEFLAPYQNWVNRPIWGWDGLAAQTKFAAFYLVPPHFESPLNWLFGLGPGHTVTRLGGWFLNRDKALQSLLMPLGATIHPVSLEVWGIVDTSFLPQESTVYFPLFTWAGMWGDIGFAGIGAYLYLCSIVWRKICVDDFGKFLMLSTFSFGWILTQMEEPGHMLTVACLLASRWQEHQAERSSNSLLLKD